MIREIIHLLNTDDYYISDEYIDFAKGKYKAPKTFKEIKQHIKRNIDRNG